MSTADAIREALEEATNYGVNADSAFFALEQMVVENAHLQQALRNIKAITLAVLAEDV